MCKLSYYGNCDPETEEEEYCIFHRPNKNEKEAEEFWRKFFDRFKPEEEKIEGRKMRRLIFNDIDCSGYAFPAFRPVFPEEKAMPFIHSVFRGNACFINARFEGDADFYKAKFESDALFTRTTFSGKALFFGAIFSGKAGFHGSIFLENSGFHGAKFKGDADFSDAEFRKSALFSNTRFYNFVNFSRAKLPVDSDPLSYASFRGAYFRHPKRVLFNRIDGKAKISFINTDISRVVFRNCSFDFLYDEFLFRNRKMLEKMLKDVEERISIEKAGNDVGALRDYRRKMIHELRDLKLDNVLNVIRMLRENFDYYMRYEESGRLFVKEMDLKKDYLLKGGIKLADRISGYAEWFAYSLYRIMGLYGESIARPIFWIFGTIILFGILRSLFSPVRGIWESLEAFLQLRWDGSWLTLAERIISVFNLGFLYISLRRKLDRRRRLI